MRLFKSEDLFQMIRAKYPLPAWAVFGEVGDATGAHVKRHADALAIALWPSRGLAIHGFEIKCFRSDWLKELAQPQKAEAIQKYCDHWWIVTNNESLVKEEELPPTWGLLYPKSGKLTVKKQAPKLTPLPPNVAFLAAILRHQSEANANEIADRVFKAKQEAYEEAVRLGPDTFRNKISHLENREKELLTIIKDFESASGLKINTWNAGDVGEAVKKLLNLRYANPIQDLERLKANALSLVSTCEVNLKFMKEVKEFQNENH